VFSIPTSTFPSALSMMEKRYGGIMAKGRGSKGRRHKAIKRNTDRSGHNLEFPTGGSRVGQ